MRLPPAGGLPEGSQHLENSATKKPVEELIEVSAEAGCGEGSIRSS